MRAGVPEDAGELCIVHMIPSSMKMVWYKDLKKIGWCIQCPPRMLVSRRAGEVRGEKMGDAD